jgi:hypothetical protein
LVSRSIEIAFDKGHSNIRPEKVQDLVLS